jgi:hypothetical protein
MQPQPQIIGQPAEMQASQFPEGAVFIQKQSSAPTIIGVFMIITGVFTVFGGAWGLITAKDTIALLDELNAELDIQIDIPAWFIWLKPVVQLVSGIAFIAGGYFLHQRKKIGVFIGWGGSSDFRGTRSFGKQYNDKCLRVFGVLSGSRSCHWNGIHAFL